MSNSGSPQPVFSVIIPAYERPELLRRAVTSVASQSFTSFELIIVDDNSSADLYHEIESALPKNHKFIRLNRNSGGSETRATGISRAAGQYIAFLDSDDYWLPERLARAVVFFEKHPDAIATTTGTRILKADGKLYSHKLIPPIRISPILDFILSKGGLIQTSSLILHRDVASRIQFRPNLLKHQDLDIYAQLDVEGIELHYLEEDLVVWDISHDSQSISRDGAIAHSVSWIEGVQQSVSRKSYLRFWSVHVLAKASTLTEFVNCIKVFSRNNGIPASLYTGSFALTLRALLLLRNIFK